MINNESQIRPLLISKAFSYLTDLFRQHYLLHIAVGGVHANTYINEPMGQWLCRQRVFGRQVVVLGAWKISAREYRLLKSAHLAA
jgi:hypothetical protein